MMLLFLSIPLYVLMVVNTGVSESCDDWGVDYTKQVWAYDGEPARIKCPLFLEYLKHNYSTFHSAGLTLMWYWMRQEQDLEEPVNFRLTGNRISREKDVVWFRPAILNDTGNYTCMLRNTTHCMKVAFPLTVIKKDPGSCNSVQQKFYRKRLYIRDYGELECPDTEGFYSQTQDANITWYINCEYWENLADRIIKDKKLWFIDVLEAYLGNYTCILSYFDHGKIFNLTRTIAIDMKASPSVARPPSVLFPSDEHVLTLAVGDSAVMDCKVFFTYLENSPDYIWWTINGQRMENISNPRISTESSTQENRNGDKTVILKLIIQDITQEEIRSKYVCHAENTKGSDKSEAIIEQKYPGYTVELACGLGVTLFVFVLVIIVYYFFWLELVLLYRAHFGTDETIGDGKEYDVYVSYARNAEEEEFVLLVLCAALENEFGYKLCIFDRDSLPGGTITDETLNFIHRSRRLIVVLSPNYMLKGTQAILELKAGIDYMASSGNIKVILVQFKPTSHVNQVKELKRARAVLSVIKWKGEKSKDLQSRFWKQLRVALPVKRKLNLHTNTQSESCYLQLLNEAEY
ncbi:interleukin-1 receptor accessory protein isoform X2 [Protopterus annectens]|uniref:interleukin-1 receptor accessory protein isoform X2 n=1 Tax=Protopterus annectens TaxID=7888 RepID=UPI001CFADA65|nr:interleukin-1 receptor accessory protein isoform X2 [Protopterus annectens]